MTDNIQEILSLIDVHVSDDNEKGMLYDKIQNLEPKDVIFEQLSKEIVVFIQSFGGDTQKCIDFVKYELYLRCVSKLSLRGLTVENDVPLDMDEEKKLDPYSEMYNKLNAIIQEERNDKDLAARLTDVLFDGDLTRVVEVDDIIQTPLLSDENVISRMIDLKEDN